MGITCLLSALWARAGHEVSQPGTEDTVEEKPWTLLPDVPPGNITLGALFSEHASGVYLDSITGLWPTRKADAFLFLDSRYHYEDTGQFINGWVLGFASSCRSKGDPRGECLLGFHFERAG